MKGHKHQYLEVIITPIVVQKKHSNGLVFKVCECGKRVTLDFGRLDDMKRKHEETPRYMQTV